MRTRYVLIVLIVVAGIDLAFDHGQHLAPYLPFAYLLGCLSMHLLHGGHGGNDGKED